ncbi:NAD(P)/FAD-dependent oxidoreductase [Pseudonocardia endophytica]|uniref:NADH dehydrogenase FAD-containing subunit n=1 Tax=Pseudonocardia endophytica TaxID=401976 RepID=A0A4V2PHU0_PSEEN|nr:FAD-dependent oxidoreductase [Pseudonocardia endophytica]TCK22096.1 NADH dehydrogenase FAD-containing subunit [Pseudonocardia endophytica]
MTATVAIIGGGYGGVLAARELDAVADVVLVEPRDAFVHNVAALRALVDPSWVDEIFLPYGSLLRRGRVVRDRAVEVTSHRVVLGSGEVIEPDITILATGSTYPFPAKVDVDHAELGKERIRAAHRALVDASSVLVLGAGPAGLELAGEIRSALPATAVTIVDPGPDLLGGGFPDELRDELRGQLADLGVELLLGTALREPPSTEPGTFGPVEVTTGGGRTLRADIWFRCYGVVPTSGYLAGDLAGARRADGHVRVTPELTVEGQVDVFAVGDLTDLPEAKMAKAAEIHAGTVADTIRRRLSGEGGEPSRYAVPSPGISLPLGPKGGASYNEAVGVLGAEQTSGLKGTHLRLDDYRERLGLR